MPQEFQIHGANDQALFNLTVHRGEGMLLLAMDWKKGKPPLSFAGFAIEYKEPGGTAFSPAPRKIRIRSDLRLCARRFRNSAGYTFPGTHKRPGRSHTVLRRYS
jgi:hypothetical protein